MSTENLIIRIKRIGPALAFLLHPFLAGAAFAMHPNLGSLAVDQTVPERINEFHHNALLHFGHALMLAAAPLLIAIAVHLMGLLQGRGAWLGFLGGVLAVGGAVVLAADKGALCLVPSAFDTLSESDFSALIPGIEAMFAYRGWLWVLQLLPLLPVGFILQSIGLVREGAVPLRRSVPMLAGSVLMANPDIDLIGLIATAVLALGFIPYALDLLHNDRCTDLPSPAEPAEVKRIKETV
jgi:hypothetical protein